MQGLTYKYKTNGTSYVANVSGIASGKFTYLDWTTVVNATVAFDPAPPTAGNAWACTATFVFPRYGLGYMEITLADGQVLQFLAVVSQLQVAEKLVLDEGISEIAANEKFARALIRVQSGFCAPFDYDALLPVSRVLFDDAFYVYLSEGGTGLVEGSSGYGATKTIKSPNGQEFTYYDRAKTAVDELPAESPLDALNRLTCQLLVDEGAVIQPRGWPILVTDQNVHDQTLLPRYCSDGTVEGQVDDVCGVWTWVTY